MSNENTEILVELKCISIELHNINETLKDLGYLRQLEEINQGLVELNPSYQKMIEFHQELDEMRRNEIVKNQ